MKRLILLLVSLAFAICSVQSQIKWEPVKSSYNVRITPNCSVISSDGDIYLCGENNIISKSTDKGLTWKQLPKLVIDKFNQIINLKTDSFGDLFTTFHSGYLFSLSVLPKDSNQWFDKGFGLLPSNVYDVSCLGDVYFVQYQTVLKYPRLKYNQSKVLKGFSYIVNSINILASNHDRVYFFTNDGIYANLDSLNIWKMINDSINYVQASCSDSTGILYLIDRYGKLYCSVDSGYTWNVKNNKQFLNTSDFFCDNSGRLYIVLPNTSYYSDDSGVSLNEFILPDQTDKNIRSVSANQNKEILINTDKNLYYSSDYGKSFSVINMLAPIEEITKCIYKNNQFILALSNGALFKSTDTLKNIISMSDPGVGNEILCIETNDSNDIYLSKVGQGLFLKTHSGSKWNLINLGLDYDVKCLIHVNYDVIIVGSINGGIYYTSDGGLSWQKAKQDTGFSTVTTMLKIDRNNVLAASIEKGLLQCSDGTGYRWNNISHDLIGKRINSMIENRNVLYAAADSDGIYKSLDYGANWQKISFFPDGTQLFNLVSLNSGRLCVLKDSSGVFYSKDGEIWDEANDGLTSKNTTCLVTDESGYLYVSTYNNGIFKSKDIEVSVSSEKADQEDLIVYPNPTASTLNLKFNLNENSSSARLFVYDVFGKQKIFKELKNLNLGENSFNLNVEGLSSGTYYYIILSGEKNITGKFIVFK